MQCNSIINHIIIDHIINKKKKSAQIRHTPSRLYPSPISRWAVWIWFWLSPLLPSPCHLLTDPLHTYTQGTQRIHTHTPREDPFFYPQLQPTQRLHYCLSFFQPSRDEEGSRCVSEYGSEAHSTLSFVELSCELWEERGSVCGVSVVFWSWFWFGVFEIFCLFYFKILLDSLSFGRVKNEGWYFPHLCIGCRWVQQQSMNGHCNWTT